MKILGIGVDIVENNRFKRVNVKKIISFEKIDEKRWPARSLAGLIDHWKNNAWIPDKLPQTEVNKFDGKGQKIYKLYQERLCILNSVDFGDLILFPILLMQSNNDLLAT